MFASKAETEARVVAIVVIIRTGMWRPGLTSIELANTWRVSQSRVEQLAAEARKRIKQEDGEYSNADGVAASGGSQSE